MNVANPSPLRIGHDATRVSSSPSPRRAQGVHARAEKSNFKGACRSTCFYLTLILLGCCSTQETISNDSVCTAPWSDRPCSLLSHSPPRWSDSPSGRTRSVPRRAACLVSEQYLSYKKKHINRYIQTQDAHQSIRWRAFSASETTKFRCASERLWRPMFRRLAPRAFSAIDDGVTAPHIAPVVNLT